LAAPAFFFYPLNTTNTNPHHYLVGVAGIELTAYPFRPRISSYRSGTPFENQRFFKRSCEVTSSHFSPRHPVKSTVGLPRIELGPHPPHGRTLPLCYSPTMVFTPMGKYYHYTIPRTNNSINKVRGRGKAPPAKTPTPRPQSSPSQPANPSNYSPTVTRSPLPTSLEATK